MQGLCGGSAGGNLPQGGIRDEADDLRLKLDACGGQNIYVNVRDGWLNREVSEMAYRAGVGGAFDMMMPNHPERSTHQ